MKDGGPAFPHDSINQNPGGFADCEPGMSLRQWYAGQALIGLLLGASVPTGYVKYLSGGHVDYPATAHAIADGMIAEGEK